MFCIASALKRLGVRSAPQNAIQIVSKSGGLGTEDIVRNIVYYFNE